MFTTLLISYFLWGALVIRLISPELFKTPGKGSKILKMIATWPWQLSRRLNK